MSIYAPTLNAPRWRMSDIYKHLYWFCLCILTNVFIIYLACGFCHVHVHHFLFSVLKAIGVDKTQLYTGLCNFTLTSIAHFHRYCNNLCLYESMQQIHSVKGSYGHFKTVRQKCHRILFREGAVRLSHKNRKVHWLTWPTYCGLKATGWLCSLYKFVICLWKFLSFSFSS